MIRRSTKQLAVWLAALLGCAWAGLAQTTYTWTQETGGTNHWADGTNWLGGVAPSTIAGDTISMNLAMSDPGVFLDLGADRTFSAWNASHGGFASRRFTVLSGHTITLADPQPTITVIGGGAARLILNNVVTGTAGLRKAGPAALMLQNASNSFSGDIVLAGGALAPSSDGALGDADNMITVTGDAELAIVGGPFARDVVIAEGADLAFREKPSAVISGAIAGSGGMSLLPGGFGSQSLTLSSTSNTFSGRLRVGFDSTVTLTMNSLADSTNAITLFLSNKGPTTFVWGSGAVAPLMLDARPIVLAGNQPESHVIENASTNPANTITINTDFTVTSTTARELVLQGVNTGDNTIAGSIPDGGGATSLRKAGTGTWRLSGVNTFTGGVTVANGVLALAGSETLDDSIALTVNGGALRLESGVQEKVDELVLGASPQPDGSYGSTSSRADNQNDTYFEGTGVLYVGIDPPPAGTVLIVL